MSDLSGTLRRDDTPQVSTVRQTALDDARPIPERPQTTTADQQETSPRRVDIPNEPEPDWVPAWRRSVACRPEDITEDYGDQ